MEETVFKCPEGWTQYRSVLYRKYKDPKPSTSFAIFDLDNTLMITPSYYVEGLARGVRLPSSKPVIPNDFVLFSPNLREKLLNEIYNGKSILIVSNQRGMLENIPLAYVILDRIELFLKESLYMLLDSRCSFVHLLSTVAPGILLLFEKYHNSGLKIDRERTFYVGDAAGRRLEYKVSSIMLRNVMDMLKSKDFSNHRYFNIDTGGNVVYVDATSIIGKMTFSKLRNRLSYDFSDCDLKWSINNGIRFYTPDEYFYNLPPYDYKIGFDPRNIGLTPFFPTIEGGLIVIIGNLSSGKTYLAKNCTKFQIISEAQFKSYDQYMNTLRVILSERQNVVIDDTNHVAARRVQLVILAHSFNVYVTFIHLHLSQSLTNHLNKIKRMYCDQGTHEYFDVPEEPDSFHNRTEMKLKVDKPTLDEGADVIYTITDDCFPMQHNELTRLFLP